MPHGQVPRLHGYGVRWDAEARCYRVLNEVTREWLRQPTGELKGFSSFSVAYSAWRAADLLNQLTTNSNVTPDQDTSRYAYADEVAPPNPDEPLWRYQGDWNGLE